ncbi:PepSY domain-containing protein [Crenalkalicoccus roseus]|uniref:PepSY domain-containing protein n=1 Tax=Crenalkalicoccus roseus TaxID=1485588 RepID=UPI0013050C3D|nr:PepSY domain-containing protein [Crenalkalicoccus roseus]
MRRILGAAMLAAALLLGGGAALAQGSPATTVPVPMTDHQIETVLRARGYSEIEGLRREGEVFRIDRAKRYGEEVTDLTVDAASGQVHNETMSEAQARAMLRERGFTEVTEVRREGDLIIARGRRGADPVEVRIDPSTGAVTRQQQAVN